MEQQLTISDVKKMLGIEDWVLNDKKVGPILKIMRLCFNQKDPEWFAKNRDWIKEGLETILDIMRTQTCLEKGKHQRVA